MREARLRMQWISGELAAMRVPNMKMTAQMQARILRDWSADFLVSRRGAKETTKKVLTENVARMLPILGDVPVDEITYIHVADMIVQLQAVSYMRSSIGKTLGALALVLDFAEVTPNPARDKVHLKLPYERKKKIHPPDAKALLAVYQVIPDKWRLPLLLVVDAIGARVSELKTLVWEDVDDAHLRWLFPETKTDYPRWIGMPPLDVIERNFLTLFEAVSSLVPPANRAPTGLVFEDLSANAFRGALRGGRD